MCGRYELDADPLLPLKYPEAPPRYAGVGELGREICPTAAPCRPLAWSWYPYLDLEVVSVLDTQQLNNKGMLGEILV